MSKFEQLAMCVLEAERESHIEKQEAGNLISFLERLEVVWKEKFVVPWDGECKLRVGHNTGQGVVVAIDPDIEAVVLSKPEGGFTVGQLGYLTPHIDEYTESKMEKIREVLEVDGVVFDLTDAALLRLAKLVSFDE